MKRDFTISVSLNDLVGRLALLQQTMTDRNDHDEAFLVGLAMSALKDQPAGFTGEQAQEIERIAESAVKRAARAGLPA